MKKLLASIETAVADATTDAARVFLAVALETCPPERRDTSRAVNHARAALDEAHSLHRSIEEMTTRVDDYRTATMEASDALRATVSRRRLDAARASHR